LQPSEELPTRRRCVPEDALQLELRVDRVQRFVRVELGCVELWPCYVPGDGRDDVQRGPWVRVGGRDRERLPPQPVRSDARVDSLHILHDWQRCVTGIPVRVELAVHSSPLRGAAVHVHERCVVRAVPRELRVRREPVQRQAVPVHGCRVLLVGCELRVEPVFTSAGPVRYVPASPGLLPAERL